MDTKMDTAEIFRYLMMEKAIPDKTILNHDFAFQTVFYKCGPSYCYCRCAFDHEYFSYISDSGDIDIEKFENLREAITNGHCVHTTKVNNRGFLRDTRVNSIHVATALGLEQMAETFVSGLNKGDIHVCGIHSEIFKIHPYELAVLKHNETVLSMLIHGHSSKCQPLLPSRKKSLADAFVYANEKENNVVQIENVSLLEIHIKKREFPMFNLLFYATEHDYRRDARRRIYELLFRYNKTEQSPYCNHV